MITLIPGDQRSINKYKYNAAIRQLFAKMITHEKISLTDGMIKPLDSTQFPSLPLELSKQHLDVSLENIFDF